MRQGNLLDYGVLNNLAYDGSSSNIKIRQSCHKQNPLEKALIIEKVSSNGGSVTSCPASPSTGAQMFRLNGTRLNEADQDLSPHIFDTVNEMSCSGANPDNPITTEVVCGGNANGATTTTITDLCEHYANVHADQNVPGASVYEEGCDIGTIQPNEYVITNPGTPSHFDCSLVDITNGDVLPLDSNCRDEWEASDLVMTTGDYSNYGQRIVSNKTGGDTYPLALDSPNIKNDNQLEAFNFITTIPNGYFLCLYPAVYKGNYIEQTFTKVTSNAPYILGPPRKVEGTFSGDTTNDCRLCPKEAASTSDPIYLALEHSMESEVSGQPSNVSCNSSGYNCGVGYDDASDSPVIHLYELLDTTGLYYSTFSSAPPVRTDLKQNPPMNCNSYFSSFDASLDWSGPFFKYYISNSCSAEGCSIFANTSSAPRCIRN